MNRNKFSNNEFQRSGNPNETQARNKQTQFQRKENEVPSNKTDTNNVDYLRQIVEMKNQENISLYNSELKYISIKKLNINAKEFIPKSKLVNK